MIVKNKDEILKRSDKLSSKYLKMIYKESNKFIKDQDPSSNIYFSIYCASLLISKISIGIEKFGEIYGLNNLNSEIIFNLICEVSKEVIKETINEVN